MNRVLRYVYPVALIFLITTIEARDITQKEFIRESSKLSAKQKIQLTALLVRFDTSICQLESQLREFGAGPYDMQYCKETIKNLNNSVVKEFKKISKLGLYIEELFNEIIVSNPSTIKQALGHARSILRSCIDWSGRSFQ